MAISKEVNILFNAKNDTKDAINFIKNDLKSLETSFSTAVSMFKKVQGLKGSKNFDDFANIAKKLESISSYKISRLGESFKVLSNVSLGNLSNINAEALERIANLDSSKMEKYINSFEKMSKINYPNKEISDLASSLDLIALLKLDDINKFEISKIQALANIKANDIIELAVALEQIEDTHLNKLKEINIKPIKEIAKINTENLVDVAQSLEMISKIGNFPNLDKFSNAMTAIGRVTSKDFTKITKGIQNISDAKFRDFSKDSLNIEKFVNSIKKLTAAYARLNIQLSDSNLKNLQKELKDVEKETDDASKSAKRAKASFSQWAFAIGSASTGLSTLGTRLYGISRGFSAVSKDFTVGLAAFTSFFGSLFALQGVIENLADFDDAIRTAGAVAKASANELEAFSEVAREMGETTRYTATEAADALKELAVTGLSVEESIAALPSSLNAAAAAGIEISKSADILTNVMTGYSKTVADLPRITDVMVAGFTNANTNIIGLGEGFKQFGPIAAAAGVQFEQTTTLLTALGDSGYKASKSGTILKNTLGRLLSPSDQINEALSKYNLSANALIKVNTDVNTGMLDLIGVFEDLRNANISTGDAMTIFGKIAGPGTIALIGQSEEKIRSLYETLSNAEGTALRVAYEMEAGLGGSLRRLKSIWDELGITIGKALENDLIDFIENLTNAILKNKDSIADFIKSFLSITGAIVNAGVSLSEFLIENGRLITDVTVAIGLLKIFSLNWTNLAAAITTFILNISSSFGLLNPYLVGLTIVLTALSAIIIKLTPNYSKLAKESKAIAESLNKQAQAAEYAVKESERLEKVFNSNYKSIENYNKAEKDLIKLITNSNISVNDKINLFESLKDKTESQSIASRNLSSEIKNLNDVFDKTFSKSVNIDKSIIESFAKISLSQNDVIDTSKELKEALKDTQIKEIISDILNYNSAIEIQKEKIKKLVEVRDELAKEKISLISDDTELDSTISNISKAIENGNQKIKDYGDEIEIALKNGIDNGIDLGNILRQINQEENNLSDTTNKLNQKLKEQQRKILNIQFKSLINGFKSQSNAASNLEDQLKALENKYSDLENRQFKGQFSANESYYQKFRDQIWATNKAFDDSKLSLKSYEDAVKKALITFAEQGRPLGEIKKDLESSLNTDKAKEFVDFYVKVIEQIKNGADASKEFARSQMSDTERMNANFQELLNSMDSYYDERNDKEKAYQEELRTMYAEGMIEKDDYEKALTDLEIKEYKARYIEADRVYNEINKKYLALNEDQRQEDTTTTKLVKEALKVRNDAYIEMLSKSNDALIDYREEVKDTNDEIKDLGVKLNSSLSKINEKSAFNYSEYTNTVKKLEEKKVNDIEKINIDLNEKLKKLQEERLNVSKESKYDIYNLENELNEKIRKINLEGASEEEKDSSNKRAAYKSLREAEYQLSQARAYGNKNALKAGESMLSQSLSLFESLKDQGDKVRGLKKVYAELAKANKIQTQIELDLIAKKEKEEKEAAEKEKIKKKEEYENDVKNYKAALNEKLKKLKESGEAAIKLYDAEILKQNQKIEAIDKEITRLLTLRKIKEGSLDLKTPEGLESFENELKSSLESIKDITNSLAEINDVNVDLEIEKHFSAFDDLYKKINKNKKELNETKKSAKSLSREFNTFEYTIKVNDNEVKVVSGTIQNIKKQLEDLRSEYGKENIDIIRIEDTSIEKAKDEIEKLPKDYTISLKINDDFYKVLGGSKEKVESELKDLIDKYGEINIEIISEINPEKIQKTKDEINEIEGKDVEILAEVTGIDDAIKLKDAIESIPERSTKEVHTKFTSSGEEPEGYGGRFYGGLIEKFARGGHVFKNLSSRYIASGSGNKDAIYLDEYSIWIWK